MSGFRSPQWLWLLAAVTGLLVLYIALQLRRKKYAVRFSNTELLSSIAPKSPGWRRHLAFALLVVALAAMTTAMAKPTRDVRVPRERATVVLALDVSLSMEATDVRPNRIAAAQEAATEFVELLPSAINVSLVSFAGTATVLVSPTTDREVMRNAIDRLQLSESTAIGEAIFSSLAAVEAFNAQGNVGQAAGESAPARLVLLSDGANTAGRSVDQAIEAANDAGVPISTIAFGTDEGTIDLGGDRVRVPADRQTLELIAQDTDGAFYEAASAEQLREVYQDLGSQIGFTKERREITIWLVGTGLLCAFAAAGLSLLWTSRFL